MNIFGEGQHHEKFIPKCISLISKSETVTIHSDSTKTRAGSRFYIYAGDVADGILFLLKRNQTGKFNLVGSEEIDNLSLATIISEILGKTLRYEMVDFHSSRPGHDLRYALSGEKMKELGWVPVTDIKEQLQIICKNGT